MSWPGTPFPQPPARARRWVEATVGPGAKVVRCTRLRGGTSSAVHAVEVLTQAGRNLKFVLRRHVRPDVVREEPWLAQREADHLQLLAGTPVLAPTLVGVDPTGADSDSPSVLMTMLPGRLELKPREIEPWLRGMAELLPAIHEIQAPPGLVHPWEIWDDLRGSEPPPWSRRPQVWRRLIQVASGPWPSYREHFVHRDFQHYNVLWQRGRPSGIVDWMNASLGPSELDFGHFRYNLLSDFGNDVAQRFLAVYREVTGHDPHPFWEALNFGGTWHAATSRADDYDAYAAALLARLT